LYRSGFDLDGSTTACHDIVFTNNEIDNVPYFAIYGYTDCYNITVGDTLATKIATEVSYSNHIHNFGYAGVGLQGSNPDDGIANFKVYYNYIHDAVGTYTNEYGIFFSANSNSNSWPNYSTARYNRVEDIRVWEGIECHGGNHINFLDNYVKNCKTGIWSGGTDDIGTLDSIAIYQHIERNIIELDTLLTGVGIIASTDDETLANRNIFIKDNTIFYTHRPLTANIVAIRAGNVDSAEITNNTIYNGPLGSSSVYGIYIYGAGFGADNVLVNNNYIYQWATALTLVGTNITGSVTLKNNICNQPPGASFKIITGDIPLSGEVFVYNNIFLQNTYGYAFETSYDIVGSMTVKNNIIGRTSSGALTYWYFNHATADGTVAIDYNIYWNTSTASPFKYTGSTRDWTYWTGTLTFDANSPNTTATLDPVFKNASGDYSLRTDFELKNTSPAINEGVDVDIDYLGTAADIGAKEKR
jgi:hypothetical protein